jgi:hypothetical protein
MTENTPEDETIIAARRKLRGLKNPIANRLQQITQQDNIIRPDDNAPYVRAATNVLNSLDVIADLYLPRIEKDPEYRGLVMAAAAYIDPASEFRLETPTIFRQQNLGVNYSSIAESDPTIAEGLRLIAERVHKAEIADATRGMQSEDLLTRVNQGIDLINQMPVSKGAKR